MADSAERTSPPARWRTPARIGALVLPADRDDIEATVLLVLIGAGVTEIALWGHRQQGRAARRSGYLEGVLGAARIVSEGDTPASTLVEVVGRQITDVLRADNCRFVTGPIQDARTALLDHDGVVTRGGHAVDVERVGLPYDEYIALLVRRGPRVIGHFLVTATSHHALHITSLRATLSNRAWNRRCGSCLALRYSTRCRARTGSRPSACLTDLADIAALISAPPSNVAHR